MDAHAVARNLEHGELIRESGDGKEAAVCLPAAGHKFAAAA
jgi:hypothetical protein